MPQSAGTARAASTATERVYQGLYAAILERRLAPGAWLREEELAASFAVSRTVVRQALHRLAQDQVIEQIHNRGARVPEPDAQRALAVFDARQLVECEVARRLAGALSAAQLARLRALVDQEAQATARGDRPTQIRLSGEFHRALAQMAGNPVFVRLIDDLLPTTSLLMAQVADGAHPGCVAHRHIDLIDALADSGPQRRRRAAAEMQRHLAELQHTLLPAGVTARQGRDSFAAYREAPAD